MTEDAKPKWTPGPWTIQMSADQRPYIVPADKGRPILAKAYRDSLDGDLPSDANANLIAAAPELYDALETISEALHEGLMDLQKLGGGMFSFPLIEAALGDANAALRKARGE